MLILKRGDVVNFSINHKKKIIGGSVLSNTGKRKLRRHLSIVWREVHMKAQEQW